MKENDEDKKVSSSMISMTKSFQIITAVRHPNCPLCLYKPPQSSPAQCRDRLVLFLVVRLLATVITQSQYIRHHDQHFSTSFSTQTMSQKAPCVFVNSIVPLNFADIDCFNLLSV